MQERCQGLLSQQGFLSLAYITAFFPSSLLPLLLPVFLFIELRKNCPDFLGPNQLGLIPVPAHLVLFVRKLFFSLSPQPPYLSLSPLSICIISVVRLSRICRCICCSCVCVLCACKQVGQCAAQTYFRLQILLNSCQAAVLLLCLSTFFCPESPSDATHSTCHMQPEKAAAAGTGHIFVVRCSQKKIHIVVEGETSKQSQTEKE